VSGAIRRLAAAWTANGTPEEVARSLEALARKVREEGAAVSAETTLRYPKEKARKA
jgi:hypothetical protein